MTDISLQNLKKSFGDTKVIHDLSIDIKDGELWMTNNRMLRAESKTKLLVTSTRELRKKHSNEISVVVKGKRIEETRSEKILGVVFSNDLTWHHQLYGEPEKPKENRTEGLLTTLSKRVGIFRKLAKYAKGTMLKSLAQGIYYSKLFYSLPMIAEVWVDEKYKDRPDGRRSLTKEDMRKLQVLQNRIEKTIYAREKNINLKEIEHMPTAKLMEENDILSAHQMGAQSILMLTRKILLSGKPEHLRHQLTYKSGRTGTAWRLTSIPRLCITSSNFINKGIRLWNMLDPDIQQIESVTIFKERMKKWVRTNIPVKPD